MIRLRGVSIACGLLMCACSDEPAGPRPTEFGGDRPVVIKAPMIESGKTYPLLLVLHGYGANGFVQAAYFQANQLATSGEALVLAPDGTVDASGKQFWNADDACCDFGKTGVDDVGYLGGLIDDVKAAYPVSDVFVVGHSNGGYMAYRMACERADAISGIVSLAGNAAATPASCQPGQPVSVLHLHGTADATVPFAGTPGASSSVQQWMAHDACGTARTPETPGFDLETSIAGAETARERAEGCPAGIGVELWAIEGGSHIPNFASTFGATLFQWLTDHAR